MALSDFIPSGSRLYLHIDNWRRAEYNTQFIGEPLKPLRLVRYQNWCQPTIPDGSFKEYRVLRNNGKS